MQNKLLGGKGLLSLSRSLAALSRDEEKRPASCLATWSPAEEKNTLFLWKTRVRRSASAVCEELPERAELRGFAPLGVATRATSPPDAPAAADAQHDASTGPRRRRI